MNPALWWLLWRQWVGPLRSLLRKPFSSRGLAALLMVSLLALLMFGQTLGGESRFESFNIGPEGIRFWAPWALLGLLSLGTLAPRGLHFRAPDVAFLFAAPVKARELVLYNVLLAARASVLSAVWITLLRGRPSATSFVGILLTLLLLQGMNQAVAVTRAWFAMRASPWGRRTIPLVLGALAVGFATARFAGFALTDLPMAWREAPARITQPFVEVILATSFRQAMTWLPWAVGETLLLLAFVVGVGARVHDASLSASQQAQAMRERRRTGGLFAISRPRAELRLPRFPRLAGAGPIAWRQSLGLVRNPSGVALYLGILALPLLTISGLGSNLGITEAPDVNQRIVGSSMLLTFIFLSILMSGNLTFDFRIDIDRMPLLKSLPISPLALAVGQTLPVALFTTFIQWVGIAALWLTLDLPTRQILPLLCVLPAANWTAIGVENAIFLLFPYRTVPEDPGDVGFAGRVLAVMAAKMISLLALAAAALSLGWGVLFLTESRIAAIAITAGSLAGFCVASLRAVAWAFRRFDVTADVPG